MKEQEFLNIALLIDAENISSNYMQEIVNKIAVYGKISVRRIYSDWTTNKMNSWKNIIKDYSLVPIQQFENTGSKNVSDFTLVIDAMDLLHEGIFDCFCIVSSDSDFTRLAQRIREKGKTVIGLGEIKTARAFINACNEFIYLNEVNDANEIKKENFEPPYDENYVKTLDEENEKQKSINQETDLKNKTEEDYRNDARELHELILKAVEELEEDDGWAPMVKISPYIKRIRPDFNSRSIYIFDSPPKIFSRLKDYFTYYKDIYKLNKENTLVKKY